MASPPFQGHGCHSLVARAGIYVRTVQEWLGHESLATTQKYLEPSKETEKRLEAMKLPF
jgi:site-specific recombinase XerD